MDPIHPPRAPESIDQKVIDPMKLNSKQMGMSLGELTRKPMAVQVTPGLGCKPWVAAQGNVWGLQSFVRETDMPKIYS